MKKPNKAMIETWKNDTNNIVFEKDGFIKIVKKNGDGVCDWINPETLKAAVDNYDELEDGCIEYRDFLKKIIEKEYAGMSPLERIEELEKSYSDNDKATIAHFNNRMYF